MHVKESGVREHVTMPNNGGMPSVEKSGVRERITKTNSQTDTNHSPFLSDEDE